MDLSKDGAQAGGNGGGNGSGSIRVAHAVGPCRERLHFRFDDGHLLVATPPPENGDSTKSAGTTTAGEPCGR